MIVVGAEIENHGALSREIAVLGMVQCTYVIMYTCTFPTLEILAAPISIVQMQREYLEGDTKTGAVRSPINTAKTE